MHRRLDIQGLRAIAVVMVVAFHAGLPIHSGFVGVDIFFVISGFVITGMMSRELMEEGQIDLARFYLRRFMRLLPALAVVTTITALVAMVVLPPFGIQQNAAKTGLGAMLISANWVVSSVTEGYFAASAKSNPLLNTWSLSVEEQFYIIFPILMIFSWRIGRHGGAFRYFPVAILSVIGGLSFALAVGLVNFGLNPNETWLLNFYSPLTRAWEFIVGALLAISMTHIASRLISRTYILSLSGLLGFIMLVSSILLISETTPFPSFWTLIPVVGTLLLIISGINSSAIITRALSTRAMVKIGDYSYSIYLWHWPLIVFAKAIWPNSTSAAVGAAIFSLIPALASYYWVEAPLRQLRTQGLHGNLRRIAFTLTPPLLLSGFVLLATNVGFLLPSIQSRQDEILTMSTGYKEDCFIQSERPKKLPNECKWNASANGRPIYILGDSNASQFTDGLIGAGLRLNRPVFSYTKSTCPLFDAFIRNPLYRDEKFAIDTMLSCRQYYEDTLAWIKTQPKGTVFVASTDQYWTYPGLMIGSNAKTLVSDPTIGSELLQRGLHIAISEIEKSGHQVVIPLTIPMFYHPYVWGVKDCSTWSVIKETCRFSMPLDVAMEKVKPAHIATRAAAQGTKAKILDLSQTLCPGGICGNSPDISWSADGLHISVPTSRYLTSFFVSEIPQ